MTLRITIPSLLGVALMATSMAFADSLPLTPISEPSSAGLSVIYDSDSGNVSVSAPAGTSLTALQLDSEGGSFNGSCNGLTGPFDVCAPEKIFLLQTDGFETYDFGDVLPADLSWEELQADLSVDGASLGGGFDVGQGPFIVHSAVPEPASVLTLVSGLGLLFVVLRRRLRA